MQVATSQKETPRSGTIVSFDSVYYSHPNGNVALHGVSFTLDQSELLAILGSNGAGKTTMVRHINGLLKPSRGDVKVFGESTRRTTAAKLSRRVGVVFQNPNNQLFAQTVRKEIEFALKNFGFQPEIVARRADWALNTFGLGEYAERPPMELSGGEKKRLCIALVLAWEPDIVIFDEPTVGQDSEQKEKLSSIVRELLLQRKTVILVTHDIEFVWPLQPRVMLMSGGQLVADGRAQDVLSDENLISRASILPPQLLDFWRVMNLPPPYPSDAREADQRIRKLVSRQGGAE